MTLIHESLPRRTVLRGLGATLALPFLDAMVPSSVSRAARAAPTPGHRFQAFYVPNGMAMEHWTPAEEGIGFTLSPILEPLAPYRDQMIVLSGLHANWNYIHAGASGSFLTARRGAGRTRPRSSPTSRWISSSLGTMRRRRRSPRSRWPWTGRTTPEPVPAT